MQLRIDPKGSVRCLYGEAAGSVEADEVDARLAADRRVGPDVDFVERREPGRRRHATDVEAGDWGWNGNTFG